MPNPFNAPMPIGAKPFDHEINGPAYMACIQMLKCENIEGLKNIKIWGPHPLETQNKINAIERQQLYPLSLTSLEAV